MQQREANPLYWLGRMGGHLDHFQSHPSEETKRNLLMAMSEFQKKVNEGLSIPKTIPPPIRNSKNFSDWYRRMLDEAMAMFRINPNEERMNALKEHLNGYMDAVAMGRVRP